MDKETLIFSIDSLTPDTLSMARLAEYLKELSVLYGSQSHVHFECVSKGSACLNVRIDESAQKDVAARLSLVRDGTAGPDANKAYSAIDKLLRNDNAVGSIYVEKGKNILIFPGRQKPIEDTITITQHTTVDGVVIKIGGRDDTIPVHLRDPEGKNIRCMVKGYAQAKELAKYYLDTPLRVQGSGTWVRDEDGWNLELLTIQSWVQLDRSPASEILRQLAKVDDNGWNNYDDPIQEWKKMRGLD